MIKITFKQQVFIGIILIVVGNVLALIFHKGLLVNIAWILYGLILILNPVYPEKYSNDVLMSDCNCLIYKSGSIKTYYKHNDYFKLLLRYLYNNSLSIYL